MRPATRRDLALVFAFSTFAITPLLRPEFFASHDMAAPLYRLLELDICLKMGNIFPRWFPDLYGGRGGLLFNFYAPFSYYVAEFFRLFGLGYINSVKAAYAVSFPLSGISMYFLVRDKTDGPAALVASVLYMYAPYRFTDVYVRGDLAEAFAFVFFPLILLSFHRLIEFRSWRYVLLLAFSYAGLILTHNIAAVLFTYFLILYLAYFAYEGRLPIRKALLSIALALSLSAFYWVPALFEKAYVTIEQAFFPLGFVPLREFLPTLEVSLKKGMSYQVGAAHLILPVVAVYLLRDRYTRVVFSIFMLTIFMMTPYSAIIWGFLPLSQFIQFPWRLLSIVTVLSSLMGGLAVNKFGLKPLRAVLLSLLIVFLSTGFIGYSEHLEISEGDITRGELVSLNSGLTYRNEYLPKGATLFDVPVDERVVRLKGDVSLDIKKEECGELSFLASSSADSLLRVNTYWFPGWKAASGGERLEILKDENGLILLEVPRGQREITLQFADTPIRKASKWASMLALAATLVFILQRAIRYLGASRPPRWSATHRKNCTGKRGRTGTSP
jgi:hypothetical protein